MTLFTYSGVNKNRFSPTLIIKYHRVLHDYRFVLFLKSKLYHQALWLVLFTFFTNFRHLPSLDKVCVKPNNYFSHWCPVKWNLLSEKLPWRGRPRPAGGQLVKISVDWNMATHSWLLLILIALQWRQCRFIQQQVVIFLLLLDCLYAMKDSRWRFGIVPWKPVIRKMKQLLGVY